VRRALGGGLGLSAFDGIEVDLLLRPLAGVER
jgi:hypothetical protein